MVLSVYLNIYVTGLKPLYFFNSLSAVTERVNPFYQPIKSLLLEMKSVFEHQDLQIFGLKSHKYENCNPLKVVIIMAAV